ncbi:MAG TPA: hypothetical protein V6D17_11690 [Candidatus Obscuribacterales bacterium]
MKLDRKGPIGQKDRERSRGRVMHDLKSSERLSIKVLKALSGGAGARKAQTDYFCILCGYAAKAKR